MNARPMLKAVLILLFVLVSGPALRAEPPPSKSSTSATNVLDELSVFPKVIRLRGRDSRQQVLVSALRESRVQDVTREVRFSVNKKGVIHVDDSGVVRPDSSGSATLTVQWGGSTRSIPVEVVDGATYLPVDFRSEIVPILTRRGCNSGGCHGKSTGRGGFRMSLFGYVPDDDYIWITRDSAGRRVRPHNSAKSLLLQKPSMAIPHGGGFRLKKSEPEFHRLARWIENNVPATAPQSVPDLERISVFPEERSLRSGDQQQLAVTAFYSDGTSKDITRLVKFKSNESTIADVDEWGLVTAGDLLGETPVIASYLGQVAINRIRIPLDREWTKPEFPPNNFIDELVLERLKSLRIPPSALSNDGAFLRRATQQIVGRLPTRDEVLTFHNDASPGKRKQLVKRLLDDPGYADHFALKWCDILRIKRRGQKPRIPGTIAFHRWIRNAIALNMPYDRFVREILTATGDVNVNPPAQWYAEVRYLDRYVDDTAQAFLGLRVGCARCHHHPFEKISQQDYYGLAAFFGRVDRKGGAGVAERRANEAIFVKPSGVVKHPVTGKVVHPHGLGGPDLQIAPFADPRNTLVDWMIEPDNRYFARAFVNRMWAHFFGRGLVDPLDDLRVTNPASNEPLLDALAKEFVNSQFNMKHIVGLICASTTYQLSSKPNEYNLDETLNFSRFYPQRLKAEVLLDVIDQVTGVATSYSGLPKGTRALQLPDEGYSNQFLTLFGRPPRESACECERAADPSLSQSLYVMNDRFILDKMTASNSLSGKLAADKREQPEKVRELFMVVLSREPDNRELTEALNYLKSESDQRKAYGNLLWALINTKEFLYVH
jgi:hypothetical protein